MTLRALATPGHTPEHLSYLILDGAHEVGVFTGSLLERAGRRQLSIMDGTPDDWAQATGQPLATGP